MLDLDEETEIIPDGDLVDLRDNNGADETIRPASPVRARVRTTTSGQRGQSSRQRQSPAVAAAADAADRLPPQTVLTRVLRELEDDYAHYKACVSLVTLSASCTSIVLTLRCLLLQDLFRARRPV